MIQEITNETIEQRNERILTETLNRAATATVSNIDEANRTVELTFASEFEVERWFGIEKLEMTPRAADLNRLNSGGALLSEHDRKQQIGKVVKAWVGDDKRAHAIVKFSRKPAAEHEFQDVVDGIRTNVSFGYRIAEHKVEKGTGNAPDKITATRWEAMEISLVSIPADPTIGVGRSQEDLDERREVEVPAQILEKAENRGSKMDNEKNDKPEAGTATTFAREQGILEYGKMFGAEDLARQIAADPNKSVADLQRALQDRYKPEAGTSTSANPTQPTNLDLSKKEVKRFSIVRAINALASGNWKDAGFERECSDAIAENMGRESAGIFIPADIQNAANIERTAIDNLRNALGLNSRELSISGGATAGGYLVGTDHLAGSFIDVLRNNMVMMSLGVRMLSGLVGNIEIPRQDGEGQVYWVAEGQAPDTSDQVFGQLAMSPKTVGAVTEFTRKLLMQSAPSVDQLVMADIAAIMARGVDKAIINGSGSAGQPRGILNTTGVDEVDIISSTWGFADAVKMESEIGEDNAPRATGFLMRPSVRGTLKTRPKIGTTFPVFVIENDECNGYGVSATTQMPTSTILFGDYSQVILGEWGVLELEANRLGSGFRAGNVEVRALHSVDVGIRYPQAFKKNTAFA